MPLWQRLSITLVTMLLTSLVSGLLWRWLFNTDIPSYVSGVVGGVTAVPVWELLETNRNSVTPDGAALARNGFEGEGQR